MCSIGIFALISFAFILVHGWRDAGRIREGETFPRDYGKKDSALRSANTYSCLSDELTSLPTGGNGLGLAAKISNNLLLAISMVGVSEAMLLGRKLGVDVKVLADIINR